MNRLSAFASHASEAGLTKALIEDVITAFYAKVRLDEVLGPLFEDAIGADWDGHIARIIQFWLTATRLDRGYDGRRFMPVHLKHNAIRVAHIPRWLNLFEQTLRERCTPPQANALLDIAVRMAENIELGLRKRDQPPASGTRQ